MGSLDNIVSITIDRQTTGVSRAAFGTPGIIAEFATDKTTVTFDRYREYASILEMADDGWVLGDDVYDAASIIFSQNPKVDKVMVGRKDSGDANFTEAFNTIQGITQDWYEFNIVASQASTVVFDVDFVTANVIDFTINGTAVTSVPFNTDQATTMADIKTQIEADITDSSVDVSALDLDTRTLIIEVFGGAGIETVSVVVTLGATQPVGAVTYVNEDDYKEAAAWAATQKKLFTYASSSAAIKDPVSESDIAFFMKNLAYDRTISCYHTDAQGDTTPAWFESGWPGECLPFEVGSQTWAYKTITGVPAYTLTSGEETAILAKNCNIYTPVAGVNTTRFGKVASGEYIDVIRGIDELEARLQEAVFADLVNLRKIPYTDGGITIIDNIVKGVLNEFADKGFLIKESIITVAPKLADIPSADKIARNLPDVTFQANLQGAIHTVSIVGVVTV